ncbi:hypothetical protein CKAH01_00166 [Colletotrichum kahawae]|uniref:Uncharacterized protein n=1 Tax=Colletotrichum kahawae TaxID=34407 RepID=A0AAE0DE60_COLKA|nr:hypothetical protein CcaCcLH18_01629 [Colletotrichum camelliae]KAK2780222.1 hypothetical protein CKAH01_00166 [Colletotrichum kahawae]
MVEEMEVGSPVIEMEPFQDVVCDVPHPILEVHARIRGLFGAVVDIVAEPANTTTRVISPKMVILDMAYPLANLVLFKSKRPLTARPGYEFTTKPAWA